jgi:hypothetical protein
LADELPGLVEVLGVVALTEGAEYRNHLSESRRIRDSERMTQMSSMRENIKFKGKLRGRGRNAECSGIAVKATKLGSGEYEYVNFIIDWVTPDDLPEGDYQLFVFDRVVPFLYRNSQWRAQI